MRKLIAALQVSVDGYIQGPNGEIDWIKSWEDPFDIVPEIDTCVLGGGMYPGYEAYWGAIMAAPSAVSPFTGSVASPGEVDYARFAKHTRHVVLSSTLKAVEWPNTRIVRTIDDIAALKRQPGKSIHAVGGASLVASLINSHLVDELRVVTRPILLGAGKALFGEIKGRQELCFDGATPIGMGMVRTTYVVPSSRQ